MDAFHARGFCIRNAAHLNASNGAVYVYVVQIIYI